MLQQTMDYQKIISKTFTFISNNKTNSIKYNLTNNRALTALINYHIYKQIHEIYVKFYGI